VTSIFKDDPVLQISHNDCNTPENKFPFSKHLRGLVSALVCYEIIQLPPFQNLSPSRLPGVDTEEMVPEQLLQAEATLLPASSRYGSIS